MSQLNVTPYDMDALLNLDNVLCIVMWGHSKVYERNNWLVATELHYDVSRNVKIETINLKHNFFKGFC